MNSFYETQAWEIGIRLLTEIHRLAKKLPIEERLMCIALHYFGQEETKIALGLAVEEGRMLTGYVQAQSHP